ncbi:MAG: hypothetical protein UY62_C0036G0009 [Parcubacteria group bacterium GW2011_GWF2_50_9]|nr:MAG: hypothetical protein UY62_C0036G0009 [Parcubacteria group bacterium GW2011_GWF2_50_9]
MKNTKKIRKGDRVRDAKWGGKYTGTVLRTAGQKVFVQWDNLAVEDEMHEAEVKALGTRVEGDIPTVVKAVKS